MSIEYEYEHQHVRVLGRICASLHALNRSLLLANTNDVCTCRMCTHTSTIGGPPTPSGNHHTQPHTLTHTHAHSHAAAIYNTTFTPDPWHYGNSTYNHTAFTLNIAGRATTWLSVEANACPKGGCSDLGGQVGFRIQILELAFEFGAKWMEGWRQKLAPHGGGGAL